jgi:predicted dehydrogenase
MSVAETAEKKMRAGVVGLGRHGFRHLGAYERLDNAAVVAVCDARAELVAQALEQYPNAKGYTDWREFLQHEQLDVLSIVTNGPTHAPVTIAAVERGVRRILCEKPMATSIRDAHEMIRVCHEREARLAVCHARRWVGSYQRLRDLIAGGVIGKPCHFWSILGGGLFAGNGTHTMDLARMLVASNPVSVTARVDQTGTPNPRGSQFEDPGAFAVYWFANGMRLVIDMYEDIGVTAPMEIIGSIGRIAIDEPAPRWEIFARANEDREQPVEQYWLPLHPVLFEPEALDMIAMLADALRELLGDGEISCTGEDGLASLEMVIGAHVSSRQGGVPVRLPLDEKYHRIDIPLT